MKKTITLFLIVTLFSFTLSGCETMKGTGTGAAIGAGTGAAFGAIFGKGKGALIGAAAGALLGAIVGNYYDRQVASRAKTVSKYNLATNDDKFQIENSSTTPQEITPGSQFKTNVQYALILPNPSLKPKVTESRFIAMGNEMMKISERIVVVNQGTNESTASITMPQNMEKGDYELITVISDGNRKITVKDPLRVV